MRGRSPQLDVDLLALDYVKWLGRGRHADRIGDEATRGCDQGQGASRCGDFAAHRAPSRKYLGRSYSRDASRGKRLIRERLGRRAGRFADLVETAFRLALLGLRAGETIGRPLGSAAFPNRLAAVTGP
jgi:hypothetical protein